MDGGSGSRLFIVLSFFGNRSIVKIVGELSGQVGYGDVVEIGLLKGKGRLRCKAGVAIMKDNTAVFSNMYSVDDSINYSFTEKTQSIIL